VRRFAVFATEATLRDAVVRVALRVAMGRFLQVVQSE
jgi:hypothetical protein